MALDGQGCGEIGRRTAERMEQEELATGWHPEDDVEDAEAERYDAFVTIIDAETGEATPWEPDEDDIPPLPSRYQIHVSLADERDLPGELLPLP